MAQFNQQLTSASNVVLPPAGQIALFYTPNKEVAFIDDAGNYITGAMQQGSSISASYAGTASYVEIDTASVTLLRLSGSFLVTGSSYVSGTQTIVGPSIITGSQEILGAITISGSQTISGSSIISGSLTVVGIITASLAGTASWAVQGGTVTVVTASNPTTESLISSPVGVTWFNTSGSALYVKTSGSTVDSNWTVASSGGSGGGAGFPYTGSAIISGTLYISNSQSGSNLFATASQAETASYANNLIVSGNLVVGGTLSSSVFYTNSASIDFTSGSNRIGNELANSQAITGSVGITGSFTMDTASAAIIPNLTGSLLGTASFAITASYVNFGTGSVDTSQTGSTTLTGSSTVSGSTTIEGTTTISGSQTISGSTTTIGTTTVTGSSIVSGSTTVIGNSSVTGSTVVSGSTTVIGTTVTSGSVIVSGSTKLVGASVISGSQEVSGSSVVSGSLNVTEGITGSLEGTASWAVNAVTASRITGSGVLGVVSASYTASLADTASLLTTTASQAYTASYVATASWAVEAITASLAIEALTASYAVTYSTVATVVTTQASASWASSSITSSIAETAATASWATYSISASIAETASYVSLPSTASQAFTASYVQSSSFALTASYVPNTSLPTTYSQAFTASYIATASHANTALTASYALSSDVTLPSTYSQAYTASYVENAISASYAVSYSYTTTELTAVTSASWASSSLSASVAENAATASYVVSALSASYIDPANIAGTGSQVYSASFSQLAATASYVETAKTASFALTASYVLGSGVAGAATSASWASQSLSASVAVTAATASIANTASFVTGSNVKGQVANALTASYALNANITLPDTYSQAFTASYVESAVSSSYATTYSYFEVTRSSVTSASWASASISASYIKLAESASYVATYSIIAVSLQEQDSASWASSSVSASYLDGTASYAYVASQAILGGTITVLSSSLPTTDSLVSSPVGVTWYNTSSGSLYIKTSASTTDSTWTALNSGSSGGGGGVGFPYSGSAIITGTLSISNSVSGTNLFATASHAISASYIDATFLTSSALVTASYINVPSGGYAGYVRSTLNFYGAAGDGSSTTPSSSVSLTLSPDTLQPYAHNVQSTNFFPLELNKSEMSTEVQMGLEKFGSTIRSRAGYSEISQSTTDIRLLFVSRSAIPVSGGGSTDTEAFQLYAGLTASFIRGANLQITASLLGTASFAGSVDKVVRDANTTINTTDNTTCSMVIDAADANPIAIDVFGNYFNSDPDLSNRQAGMYYSINGMTYYFNSRAVTSDYNFGISGLTYALSPGSGFTSSNYYVGTGSTYGTSIIMHVSGGYLNNFQLTGSLLGTASRALTASYFFNPGVTETVLSGSTILTGSATVSGSQLVIGASTVSGTLNVTGGITGSLLGTASWAFSASQALTASSADNFIVRGTLSSSVFYTNSASIDFTSGSNKIGNELANTQAITGSVGITGSLTMDSASRATFANLTGSLYGTASSATSASYVSGSSGSIANFTVTSTMIASYLQTANYVDDAAAAAGGVPLYGVYRSGNMLVVRIA